MSKKIDKQECAKLVVEAALLTQAIIKKYPGVNFLDTPNVKAVHVYKKSLHKYRRRVLEYNEAFDTTLDAPTHLVAKYCGPNYTKPDKAKSKGFHGSRNS